VTFAVLLVITFHVARFTLPAEDADSRGACSGIRPLFDLATVEVVAWTGHGDPYTLAVKNVKGKAGLPDSLLFSDMGLGPMWVGVRTRDSTGNVSCVSNLVALGTPTVSVELSPSLTPEPRWYDVAGRRLASPPTTPGIYFVSDHGHVRRLVVVR